MRISDWSSDVCSSDLPPLPVEVQIRFGCHRRRKPASASIEQIAATTSTSQGPWKFETRYCGIAKERPATRSAGHTSIVPLRPAKAQISQDGTITEKNGS